MARICYLAMLSVNPSGLAAFYTRQLGMQELGRNDDGDVTLTDGGFNLTLFRNRAELREPHKEVGLHHLGIAVENIDETLVRYRAFYPRGVVVPEPGDLHHGEMRIYDPECNPISLSQRDFGVPLSVSRVPRIAHIALNALDTGLIFDFYAQVFGFRELMAAHAARRQEHGYRNRHAGDGHCNVAIQAFYNEEEGFEPRFGIAHIGFIVPDSKAAAERVVRGGATVTPRPARRTQSEIRMRDPEGNGCDLSQRGWEVDVDKWVRADAA
jgi:catechol 2,3-dioxygenase-like lactoylglutathione lyase family enzyme